MERSGAAPASVAMVESSAICADTIRCKKSLFLSSSPPAQLGKMESPVYPLYLKIEFLRKVFVVRLRNQYLKSSTKHETISTCILYSMIYVNCIEIFQNHETHRK